MAFELTANVDVHRDSDGRIRTLRHQQDPFSPEMAGLTDPAPEALADQYVHEVAPLYGIDESQLGGLAEEALAEPAPEGAPLRRPERKPVGHITVAAYPRGA